MIRIREVRLIDEKGEQVGVVPTEEALSRAQKAQLDLVEVSPRARPPVCKIMDYGKFKYDQRKKEQQQNTRKQAQLKELRVRPKTSDHDLGVKLRKARGFLEEGHKVLFNVFFRGRERSHTDLGRYLLERIAEDLDDIAKVERMPAMDGRRMTMMLLPRPQTRARKKAAAEAEKAKEAEEQAESGEAKKTEK
jgi:translation initiation factor IF-3